MWLLRAVSPCPGLLFALALFVAMLLRRIRLPVSRPVLKHWHYFPGSTPKPAPRRGCLLFPFNKINLRTAQRPLCFKKEKYDNLHLARGMAEPAASPPFLYWSVYRTVYLCRCPDRYVVRGDAAAGKLALSRRAAWPCRGTPQPLSAQIAVAEEATRGNLRLLAVRPAPALGETTRIMFADPGLGESESRAILSIRSRCG